MDLFSATKPMRLLLLILFGLLLPQSALALPSPPLPQANSTYVQEVLDTLAADLALKTSPGPGSCTALQSELSRATAAARLRSLFVDREAAATEPLRDFARSACYAIDLRAMEHVLALLIHLSVQSAEQCDGSASEHYFTSATDLYEKLRQVRAFGLNPHVQVPITGTGASSPPLTATSASDDALCPYDSDFAAIGIGSLGCHEILYSTFASILPIPTVFIDELSLMEDIVVLLQGSGGGGLSGALPLYRSSLQKLDANASAFVQGVTSSRFLGPLQFLTPTLSPFVAGNVGESGCFGWPADAGGVVTGLDIAHQNAFPGVFTQELAEAFTFLRLREEPQWREYEQNLAQNIATEGGALGYTLPVENLSEINREHIARESHLILAIRDPQIRMANLANTLHSRTRAFTAQAVGLTGLPAGTPPLRDFAKRFAEFLMGMCTNRGCSQTLLRAVELSVRDECFPHFRSALFFAANPSAGTLRSCRAAYVDP